MRKWKVIENHELDLQYGFDSVGDIILCDEEPVTHELGDTCEGKDIGGWQGFPPWFFATWENGEPCAIFACKLEEVVED
jgi:hypothetical protein